VFSIDILAKKSMKWFPDQRVQLGFPSREFHTCAVPSSTSLARETRGRHSRDVSVAVTLLGYIAAQEIKSEHLSWRGLIDSI
jgi:hypothetical protein